MSRGLALDAARAAFVQAFVEGWSLGAGADAFCDHFLPTWIDPDVVLVQPTLPEARGHDGFRRFAREVFELSPDLRADVLAVAPTDDGVVLDLWFHGTIGGRPTGWSGRDTITLRDGRLLRREAEFELGPALGAAARDPGAAAALARAAVPEGLIDRGLFAMAVGRLGLGGLGRLAPGAAASAFGAGAARSPELDYVTRVFGIRAIALGLGYLSTAGDARRRWQRLAFLCDVSDTVAGIGDLVRGRVPRSTALRATVLTGTYAAIGAAAILNPRAGTARPGSPPGPGRGSGGRPVR